jgi:hypothetical protein
MSRSKRDDECGRIKRDVAGMAAGGGGNGEGAQERRAVSDTQGVKHVTLEPGIGFLAKKLGKPPIKSQRLSYQNKM